VASFDISAEESRTYPNAHSIDRFLLVSQTGLTLVWILSMAFTTPEVIRRRAALLSSPTSDGGYLLYSPESCVGASSISSS